MANKLSKTPYLRFGETERPIMGPAVDLVGNAKALLQLRRQIDRALGDEDRHSFDEMLYRDEHEEEYQVLVRRAKSKEEMRPPVPRVEEVPEKIPLAVKAHKEQERREQR